ncbi:MAG: HD domain-containing phosphohydrolase [Actinomycetota bacterium]
MAGKKLNTLIIEDSENDALLVVEQLKREGFEVSFERVETRNAFKAAVEKRKWDVILADYKLPQFNADEALKLLHEQELDIPFIVVSGNIGENVAVNLMKRGAHDYIMKDNLTRLYSVVDREVRDARIREEKRKTEKELIESIKRLDLAVKAANLGTWDYDIKKGILRFNREWARMVGVSTDKLSRKISELRELIHPEDRKKVFEKLNRYLSGKREDYEAEHRIKCKSGDWKWVFSRGRIFERGEDGKPVRMFGINLDIDEAKKAELKREEEIRAAFEQMVNTLSDIVEIKDAYTAGHQKKVAVLAAGIAKEMGFSPEFIETVKLAAMIHDLGKISIPASILSKPGKLSDIEWKLIKTHPIEADNILKNNKTMEYCRKIILQHHERMDGSGYPKGLKGEEIMMEAKIIAVADVVEAMTSYRPYRQALGLEAATKEIIKNKGKLYDKPVVEACIKVIERDPSIIR